MTDFDPYVEIKRLREELEVSENEVKRLKVACNENYTWWKQSQQEVFQLKQKLNTLGKKTKQDWTIS